MPRTLYLVTDIRPTENVKYLKQPGSLKFGQIRIYNTSNHGFMEVELVMASPSYIVDVCRSESVECA